MANDIDELRSAVERVRQMLENLVVRGLRACGADELTRLRGFAEDLERSGVGHVAGELAELHAQVEKGERAAARTLLLAQTSVRLLERLLTLRVIRERYQLALATEGEDDGSAGQAAEGEPQPPTAFAAAPEAGKLRPLLEEIRGAVEELLLGGLTAASKSTVERMDVTFKEASRMKLLRLGSTLRIANEEISRFTAGSPQFSARRLSFFLSRAWVLAVGMGRALERADAAQLGRLMATPASEAVGSVKVVTLGVSKRVLPGAFATFEFRLRATEDSAGAGPARAGAVRAEEALVWSCVFPMRQGLELPAEAFLHLPQKQKFKPSVLLERKVVEITRCAVSRPATSAARLTLTDASEVKPLAPFTDWAPLWQWRPRDAGARVEHYRPTPVDLEYWQVEPI